MFMKLTINEAQPINVAISSNEERGEGVQNRSFSRGPASKKRSREEEVEEEEKMISSHCWRGPIKRTKVSSRKDEDIPSQSRRGPIKRTKGSDCCELKEVQPINVAISSNEERGEGVQNRSFSRGPASKKRSREEEVEVSSRKDEDIPSQSRHCCELLSNMFMKLTINEAQPINVAISSNEERGEGVQNRSFSRGPASKKRSREEEVEEEEKMISSHCWRGPIKRTKVSSRKDEDIPSQSRRGPIKRTKVSSRKDKEIPSQSRRGPFILETANSSTTKTTLAKKTFRSSGSSNCSLSQGCDCCELKEVQPINVAISSNEERGEGVQNRSFSRGPASKKRSREEEVEVSSRKDEDIPSQSRRGPFILETANSSTTKTTLARKTFRSSGSSNCSLSQGSDCCELNEAQPINVAISSNEERGEGVQNRSFSRGPASKKRSREEEVEEEEMITSHCWRRLIKRTKVSSRKDEDIPSQSRRGPFILQTANSSTTKTTLARKTFRSSGSSNCSLSQGSDCCELKEVQPINVAISSNEERGEGVQNRSLSSGPASKKRSREEEVEDEEMITSHCWRRPIKRPKVSQKRRHSWWGPRKRLMVTFQCSPSINRSREEVTPSRSRRRRTKKQKAGRRRRRRALKRHSNDSG
ncbi:uncharacterized protein ACJ7VT_016708 [Polymixia lowei]